MSEAFRESIYVCYSDFDISSQHNVSKPGLVNSLSAKEKLVTCVKLTLLL